MNQKGSATLPIIIVVLVVVVIGGYFVFYFNRMVPDKTPNISEESAETAQQQVGLPTTVLSPNGGEQWQVGETYIISWNTSEYSDKVNLSLIKVRDQLASGLGFEQATGLIANTDNTGSYSWTIPSVLRFGTDNSDHVIEITNGKWYKVDVSDANKNNGISYKSDEFFTISN